MGDKIPGGLAKGKSLQDIAKHHKVPTKYIISALEKGIQVEKEHTTDESVAREIAMDHLWEDPKYYNKLEKMESGEKLDEGKNKEYFLVGNCTQIGNENCFTPYENATEFAQAEENYKQITKDQFLEKAEINFDDLNIEKNALYFYDRKYDVYIIYNPKEDIHYFFIKNIKEVLKEGKNIGILYHFTSLTSFIDIINQNYLRGTYVSFTRDKNLFWKEDVQIGGTNVRIVLDGNKLSEKYKIQPFNDVEYSWKAGRFNLDYNDSFEAEERIKGSIDNLDKYVISYDVIIDEEFNKYYSIVELYDKIYTLSLHNPKIKFYYKGDQVSSDILKQQFKQVAAETKSKADKYGIESYARELAQGLEEILTEGKNIGVLYHFTSPLAAQLILKQNKIKSSHREGSPYISFTRDKNLYKQNPSINGIQVRLVLDGNKISDNYKLRPYDYLGHDRKHFSDSKNTDYLNKSRNFEAEEFLDGKDLINLDKYLISVDLIDPINWSSISSYDYFLKGGYKYKIPLRVIDKNGKITDATSYEKQLKQSIAEYQNQKTLNPNLWENNHLKQKYKEGLQKIAQFFIDKIDLEPKIDDIILTGSSANYNWTQYSDVDLHILLDFQQFKDSEISKKYFDQLKNNWNKEFDLKIGNNEIELYFQDTNEPHAAMGVYSLVKDKWLKEPTQENVEVSDEEIQKKAIPFKQQIDSLQELPPEEALPQIEKLKEKIRRFRKCGLENGGEYSVENLAFKELRNSGYLEKINLIKKDDEQKELSSFINENQQFPNSHKTTKTLVKRITKFLLDKGLKIEPLPKVKFVYSDLVNAKDSLGKTAHYDFDRAYITLYTRYRHPKDVVRSFVHEMIHHEQKLAGKIKDITTTNINDDDNLKELEREAYEKGNMLFREWENSLDKEKPQLNEDYPSEYFDNKYGTQLSHKWNGEELLNVDEIRSWQRIKLHPLTKEQLDKIDDLYSQIIEKNPELKKLKTKDYQEKIDILHGVESRFNIDDIEYFLSDEHQKRSDEKRIERHNQITSTPGIKDKWDIQWVVSPKSFEKMKQSLNETPLESNHPEIKYWALFANIYDALKKDPDNVYQKLVGKLSGEQLKALEYFYPLAKDPSLLKEGKNIGPLYHFTNFGNLINILKENELNSGYEHWKIARSFISFTRNKNFNKQIRSIKGLGVRLVLDGNKLSENYKIEPYNDKAYSIKGGRNLNGTNDGNFTGKVVLNKYDTFEAEERVKSPIKDLDKYVISYDVFVDKAEEELEDLSITNKAGINFNEFLQELEKLSKNLKVQFYLNNKKVSWKIIEAYYGLQKVTENILYNLALKKDPKGLTWLGASVLKDVLEEIQPKEKIKYDKWVLPSEDDLKREYKVEHKIKGRNEFPTEESFLKAIKNAQPEEITPEKDKSIDYRVQTKDYDELLSLIKTFKSYPQYRNEETLKSLYEKIKNNQPLDMPIIMEYSDGSRRILSGNTRMNVAFQLGVNPKVLIVKVPDKNLNENVDKQELKTVELQADRELSPIDVKFSDHFFERVNDPRNEKEIHVEDLFDFFDHLTNHKDQLIAFLKKYRQIVVKDKKNQINIPFVKVADKILAKTIMVKKNFLTQDPQLVVSESKQVGDVYHFTSLSNFLQILADNKIKTGDIYMFGGDNSTISTTRDKNFISRTYKSGEGNSISGDQIGIMLDGTKLSNKFKVRPYNYSYDQGDPRAGDEQEELFYGKKINQQGGIRNLNKYIKGIIFTPKFSWEDDFTIPEKYINLVKEYGLEKINIPSSKEGDYRTTDEISEDDKKEIFNKIVKKELPGIKIDYQK